MIYDHIVKFNGKYYNAGEDVPENEESLDFDGTENLFNKDAVLETDSVIENKTSGRRGRPKKSEQ